MHCPTWRLYCSGLRCSSVTIWMVSFGQTFSHCRHQIQRSWLNLWIPLNRGDTSGASSGYSTVNVLPSSACFIVVAIDLSSPIIVVRSPFCRSSVHAPEHDVEAPQRGDHVGDVLAFGHLRQRVEVVETRAADLEPGGLVGAIRANVDAEFAFGDLDGLVHLLPGLGAERPRDVALDLALVLGPVLQ